MKRLSCALVAIVILTCCTQVLAQKGPATKKSGDELKDRITEAFTKSKPIRIRVKNASDLSGTQTKDGEVTGLVKSVTGTCFRFEYKDASKHLQNNCIPYGDAVLVTWQTRALHILRVVGEDTAIGAAGVVVVPVLILVFVTAALIGHPISGC